MMHLAVNLFKLSTAFKTGFSIIELRGSASGTGDFCTGICFAGNGFYGIGNCCLKFFGIFMYKRLSGVFHQFTKAVDQQGNDVGYKKTANEGDKTSPTVVITKQYDATNNCRNTINNKQTATGI